MSRSLAVLTRSWKAKWWFGSGSVTELKDLGLVLIGHLVYSYSLHVLGLFLLLMITVVTTVIVQRGLWQRGPRRIQWSMESLKELTEWPVAQQVAPSEYVLQRSGNRDLHRRSFMHIYNTLPTVAKRWRPLECPLTDEGANVTSTHSRILLNHKKKRRGWRDGSAVKPLFVLSENTSVVPITHIGRLTTSCH